MFIDLPFPLKGKDSNFSVTKQPPLTSSEIENVRPYDVFEDRARGGQRPGLQKWASEQVGGGAYHIDRIVQITCMISNAIT